MISGIGSMLCDYEVLHDQPYQSTIICHSISATVLQIRREDIMKLDQISEDSFQLLVEAAIDNNKKMR